MKEILAKLRERSVDRSMARNMVSLYGVQFTKYLVPLITIPYLTRVLGPAMWGLVAFAQAFGAYATVGVEYGFNLSATREVAKSRDSKSELADLLAGVMGAKLLLTAGIVLLAFLLEPWIPLFHKHPIFLWAAVFWAAAQAFGMLWYYQGIERMRLISVLDVVGRAGATVAIFIFVRHPGDAWKVLVLQGAGLLFAVLAATVFIYREVPIRLPRWSLVRKTLRMGWSMFVFRGSTSLYGAGNAFILGLFVPPEVVGFYAGAEKIVRAVMSLLVPVHKTLFPRLNRLVREDRTMANRLAKLTLFAMTSAGTVFTLAAFLGAPWIIPLALGKSFAASIPVLRILSPLPLLDAAGTMLGILWMVPLGLDRQFNKVVLAGGVLNLILAAILAPRFAQFGMAAAVVSTEIFVVLTLYFTLHRQGLSPLAAKQHEQE